MSAPPKLDFVAQMYQARSKLKFGLGKNYSTRLAPIIAELKKVMAAHQVNEVQAALMMVKAVEDEKDPQRKKTLTAFIFSAALDIDDEQAQNTLHPTP